MIGATLARRYALRRLIGQGGMGQVYEADHTETGERVAVKVLHGHLLDAEGEGARRFRREAEAAGAIHGDHIVRVLDAGTCEETGHLYLVTEYLDGEDLQRLLDRTGPLSPEGALRVAWQALAGLVEAHAARVVHRDVKPANLFVARGEGREGSAVTMKILDFGIAKVRPDPLGLTNAAGLTTTGGILGSPLYMSPEQVQSSRDVDHRTDLWSVGCVLYACIAGRAPHQHLASVGQLLVAICTTPPPPLREVAPWVPAGIAEVVGRALAIHPDARYPSAEAMLDAIRRLTPTGALSDALLVPSGEHPRPVSAVSPASTPPSPSRPRVVVAPDPVTPVRGDDETQHAGSGTLASAPPSSGATPRSQTPGVARSGVPALGAKAGGRLVIVDPRRVLGETSELWSLSLDVHKNLASLVARIYRSLNRAGAKLPPMTYGKAWALVEARTGDLLLEQEGEGGTSLEAAGIEPGVVLWVVRLDGGTDVA